ncbi:MAG: hypothetical protein KC910_14970 [Candidatus Eremiobacteraeota bacterium]|nr:hypothetical protein [Candidatus Eremiobacteraeota bacterium]
MTEQEAIKLARQHLQTEREPRQASLREHGDRRLWQVSFAGDGQPPQVVTIDANEGKVLQVFEPLKIQPTAPIMDIITTFEPETYLE